MVFKEGGRPSEVYIVRSGEFKLTRLEHGNSIFKSWEIVLLGPGTLFGEEAIIEGRRR
jgi:CRP-like cAMP-binding protein